MTKSIQNVTGEVGRGGDGDFGIASTGVHVGEKELEKVPEGTERGPQHLGEPGVQGTNIDEHGMGGQRSGKRSRRGHSRSKERAPANPGTAAPHPAHSTTGTRHTHHTHPSRTHPTLCTHTPSVHTTVTPTHTAHAYMHHTLQPLHTCDHTHT